MADTAPIFIENMGRMKSLVISYAMYERFTELENAYWAEQAERAEAEGYLGEEVSESLLDRPGDGMQLKKTEEGEYHV